MTNPIIVVDNIHKSYLMGKEAVPALRGVSMKIEKGDFVCLMGPSGSGKTTLLNIIGGLDEPSRGHVTVDGENLVAIPYSQAYQEWLVPAAEKLRAAAGLTDNESLKRFLELRADAFASDDYYESDKAWMDLDSFVEVTIAADAEPGAREIRLATARGVTNPLVFHVGQVPEVARKAMKTCTFQVLGKEHLAQRKRPPEEEEARITVPCTMNGQIASGEVNRYRFEARKGQRLVISTAARELIPYLPDAVPGVLRHLKG